MLPVQKCHIQILHIAIYMYNVYIIYTYYSKIIYFKNHLNINFRDWSKKCCIFWGLLFEGLCYTDLWRILDLQWMEKNEWEEWIKEFNINQVNIFLYMYDFGIRIFVNFRISG